MFVFSGLLIARVSLDFPLVNDFPLCFAASLMVSARQNIAGLPDFPLFDHLSPASRARWERVPPLSVFAPRGCWFKFPLHVWMYLSLMLVRAQFSSVDACSPRFWAYLLPQTRSARELTLGRTASEAPVYR